MNKITDHEVRASALHPLPELSPGACRRLERLRRVLAENPLPAAGGTFLLVLAPGSAPRWTVLGTQAVTLGRGEVCDIRIPHPTLSGLHARLSPKGERWRYEDMGSKNGSHINNRVVHQRLLCTGDVIALGEAVAVFVVASEADASASRKK